MFLFGKSIDRLTICLMVMGVFAAPLASADSITFSTPTFGTHPEGRPISASAEFVFNTAPDDTSSFLIKLTNTLNPASIFEKSQQMITGLEFTLRVADPQDPNGPGVFVSDTSAQGLTLDGATGRLASIDRTGVATIDVNPSALSWSFHTDNDEGEHPEYQGSTPYAFSLLDFHPNAKNGIIPLADGGVFENFRGGIRGQSPYVYHQGLFEIGSDQWDFDFADVEVTDVTIYFGTDLSGSISFPPPPHFPPPPVIPPVVPVPAAGWVGVVGLGVVSLLRRKRK